MYDVYIAIPLRIERLWRDPDEDVVAYTDARAQRRASRDAPGSRVMKARALFLGRVMALCTACDTGQRYDQAVAILIDVSSTYADQKAETIDLIKKQILPSMVPGNTIFVIRIDSESYDEENLEVLMTLEERPSQANAQKLALAQLLDRFASRRENARHTDIPGALMLASEYLKEIGAGSSAILMFSDIQTDLPKGTRRVLRENELEGARVAAVNVKRLAGDTYDPEVYRSRLSTWEQQVLEAGALEWRAILDPKRLTPFLSESRG